MYRCITAVNSYIKCNVCNISAVLSVMMTMMKVPTASTEASVCAEVTAAFTEVLACTEVLTEVFYNDSNYQHTHTKCKHHITTINIIYNQLGLYLEIYYGLPLTQIVHISSMSQWDALTCHVDWRLLCEISDS